MVSVQHGPAAAIERWPLVADIIECLTEIDGLEDPEGNDRQLIFDPAEFQ